MIQVVFCTDGIFPHSVGGMQRHSRLLIEELVKSKEMDIVVIHPHEGNVFNDIRIKEISLEGIDDSKLYLKECFKYSKRVFAALEDFPNAIIYSQGMAVWYNCSKLTSRLIVNPHGLEPYQSIGFKSKILAIPFKVVFNRIFKNSKVVISLGGKLTEILKRKVLLSQNVVEISNAVLPQMKRSFSKPDENKVNVLFLARFASNKGIDILFEAIERINNQGYSKYFNFILGGKGPLYEHYLNRNALQNVKLLGFVKEEELSDLFRSNNLFVLPTLFEGMPTVVLEAMSHGLSIIVSDVGATKLMVDDSNGKLIQAGSINALVDALKWYSRLDFESRSKLSENSYVKVSENFTWEKIARDHVDLFRTLQNK